MMRKQLYLLLIFLLTSEALDPGLHAASNPVPGDSPAPVPAAAVHPPVDLVWRPGLGYLPESEIPADWKFDVDAFLQRLARTGKSPGTSFVVPLGTGDMAADLNYYYDDYIMHLTHEAFQHEVDRMKQAARKYKSPRLEDELRFLKAFPYYYASPWEEPIARGRKTADQLEKEGKLILAVRLRYDLLRKATSAAPPFYHLAFRVAGELLDDLDRVTDEEFFYKRAAYSAIGHLHYTFRDYDKALPLLRKALVDKTPNYFDTSNLRARNTLAVYYQSVDSLDRAEEYYQSMLASPDSVYARPMFNAIAWANLGRIYAQRGDCTQSMPLYEAALPIAIRMHDNNFAAGILISMGECYLAQGNLKKTREMIDTTLVWIRDYEKFVSPHRYRNLYPLIGKYYLRQGDIKTFELYADSTALAEKKYQEVHNARVILRAQDEIFEAEKMVRDEQITAQHRQLALSRAVIILAAVGIILLVVALGIRIVYSRRLADKVRSLMEQLAKSESPAPQPTTLPLQGSTGESPETSSPAASEPGGGTLPLYRQIIAYMRAQHPYTNPALTRKDIAAALGSNENYIYKAIKQNTGLTFNEYLYYLRLEHASRMLTSPESGYTVEAVAIESGYRSRKTFHTHFRDRYGMTPDEYRNANQEKRPHSIDNN